jgi:hypothetical protein
VLIINFITATTFWPVARSFSTSDVTTLQQKVMSVLIIVLKTCHAVYYLKCLESTQERCKTANIFCKVSGVFEIPLKKRTL